MPKVDTSGIEIVDDTPTSAAADAVVDEASAVDTTEGGDEIEASAEGDQVDGEGQDDGTGSDDAGGDDGEVVITLGDEQPPSDEEEQARAPEWIRELRKANREKDRALRAKDEEIARLKGATQQPAQVTLGPKPKLEDPGIDFDGEKFAEALEKWHEQKAQVDAEEAKAKQAREADQRAWASRLESYAKDKTALKVTDFDDAEDAVKASTSITQQSLLLKQKDAAKLIYALGKNPAKLKELSAIADPIDFTIAATQMALQVKVTPKKSPPPPERKINGGLGAANSVESKLDKLREKAQRTGDMTELMEYKRQLRQKATQAA